MFPSGLNSCFVTRLSLRAFRQSVASAGRSASAARCRRFSGPRFPPSLQSMGTRGDPSAPAVRGTLWGPGQGPVAVGAEQEVQPLGSDSLVVTFPPRSGLCQAEECSGRGGVDSPAHRMWVQKCPGLQWLPFCTVAPPE
uniref:Uncharacterized protein n=1 Tax=Molossus molossus TaxID=27622 RepID=A0A7J8CRY5_MOLMO|nr:hypothetical protein HJG59_009791 [Molossus molossus]